MARQKVSPVPKITSWFFTLVTWALVVALLYTGYDYYKAYSQGQIAGARVGRVLAERIRMENLRGLRYTQAVGDFVQTHQPKMKSRSWREQLYLHGWETGLHSEVDPK